MIATYHYGEPRADSSFRIGVARQPPRGIRHEDYRRKNYFDLWLRVLSPSQDLVHRYRNDLITFSEFEAGYRSEMNRAEPRQVIDLLAVFARIHPISIGCFCEHEDRCHRSLLKRMIESSDSDLPPGPSTERRPNASPVCFLEDE